MFCRAAKIVFGVVGLSALASAGSHKAGSTVNVDDIFYYVPSTPVSSLGVAWNQLKSAITPGEDLIPLTVMSGDFATFDSRKLKEEVDKYSSSDDVFSPGFLQGQLVLPYTQIRC